MGDAGVILYDCDCEDVAFAGFAIDTLVGCVILVSFIDVCFNLGSDNVVCVILGFNIDVFAKLGCLVVGCVTKVFECC
jgi:uncharacterized membrane protein (Fun14 family)